MRPQLAALDAGTVEALYVFAIAGIAVAVALVCAGLTTRRKDHKASHFYFIAAAMAGGVSFLLIALAMLFAEGSH
jgi:uncharacterized membrane protein YozB (DUF420 family)